MVTFLRKLFIKNYQDVGNQTVRTKHGVLAAFGGIFANLILFAVKITIGLLTCSISIVSDAINNLTDLFSCFVNLIGFKISNKKADSLHPYGYERTEYIAGMIISFVIIAVAVLLGYTSIMKLVNPGETSSYNIWAFVILAVSILVKVLLGLFYNGLGKAINSVTLKASKQDSFNDTISTTLVLVAALVQYFVPSLWWLDPAMSIGVALFILFSGIKMIKETSSPLIGLSPDSEFVKNIVHDIKSFDGVLGVHDIVCHSYGPTKTFITIHVEVDGHEDMFESHDIIDNIEETIGKKYGVELTIHMDPIDTQNAALSLLKSEIDKILKDIDVNLQFHDLRMTNGPTHCNVVFDVVMPNELKLTDEQLTQILTEKVKQMDSKFNTVIKVDRNYLGSN